MKQKRMEKKAKIECTEIKKTISGIKGNDLKEQKDNKIKPIKI